LHSPALLYKGEETGGLPYAREKKSRASQRSNGLSMMRHPYVVVLLILLVIGVELRQPSAASKPMESAGEKAEGKASGSRIRRTRPNAAPLCVRRATHFQNLANCTTSASLSVKLMAFSHSRLKLLSQDG
jgi:hypothetical protein